MSSKYLVRRLAALALALLLLSGPGGAPAAQARELVFGMSAAFSGSIRGLGVEYYRGLMACFRDVNSRGGVNGHTFAVQAYDDGYNPGPCVTNSIRLVEQDLVFALLNYVGTPTTTRMLPLLRKYDRRNVYLLFPFTGAEPLRTPPYGKYVYNLRASYFDETRGLVDSLVGAGRERIAVFYQADAYGRNGWDGVRRALLSYGLQMVGEAAYRRGSPYERDYSQEVEIIAASEPEAVVMIGSYAACSGFVRDARDSGLDVPIASVSFSDSDNMLKLLLAQERAAGKDYTSGLIFSQVVPSYEDISLPAVREYRQLMDADPPMPPERLLAETYEPQRYSMVSFEGFLNGKLVVEMIRRMGDDVRPGRIPEVMDSIVDFDMGIGTPVSYAGEGNQGLHSVHYAVIRSDRLVPLRSWREFAR